MIYDSLRDVASDFEVFLFDAYGVFWGGSGFYVGSREFMRELVAVGKTVVVLSNSTQLHEDMVTSYQKKGLVTGRDCSFMLSSGELLRHELSEQRIAFSACSKPQKYFVIGKPHAKAFADTIYKQTENLEDADFVYCGIPYLFADEVKKYPQFQNDFLPVKKDEFGNVTVWDTKTFVPFEEIVEEAAKLNLPVLNANPDFFAKEGHPLAKNSESVFVVRNGMLAEMFRQRNCEVLEFGKPHKNIYDYTFGQLKEKGVMFDKSHVCMVGDTVRTDIKGAVNAGICPILCLETGVTAEEISKGKSVESLCLEENIDVKQVIRIKSVGEK